MLKNADLGAKIGFDTAANELSHRVAPVLGVLVLAAKAAHLDGSVLRLLLSIHAILGYTVWSNSDLGRIIVLIV